MEAKGKSSNKLKNNLEALEEKSKTDAELVTDAQNHYHAVSAGLSSNDDGEDKTLADQMMGMGFTDLEKNKSISASIFL